MVVLMMLALVASASASPIYWADEMPTFAGDFPLDGDVNLDCVVDHMDVQATARALYAKTRDLRHDVNSDGQVNETDLSLVNALRDSRCSLRLLGDIDGSGLVDNADRLLIFNAFGSTWVHADLNGDEKVNAVDIQIWDAMKGESLGRRILGDINGNNVVDAADLKLVEQRDGSFTQVYDVSGDNRVSSIDVKIVQVRIGDSAAKDLPGDVNGDKRVDGRDVRIVQAAFGSGYAPADINGDGVVNSKDEKVVTSHILQTAGERFEGDINGDWTVDDTDLDLVRAFSGFQWPQADIDGNGYVENIDFWRVSAHLGRSFSQMHNGDVNADCVINNKDRELILAAAGTSWKPADVDGNGEVNTADAQIVVDHFNQWCGVNYLELSTANAN